MKIYVTLFFLAVGALSFAKAPQPMPQDSCTGSPIYKCGASCAWTCGQTCGAIAPIGGSVSCTSYAYVAYCNAYSQSGQLVAQQTAGGNRCAFCCSM